MKRLMALLVLTIFATGSRAQDETFSYQAAVRVDGAEVVPVQASLSLNTVREFDVGGDLVLEFTSPASAADDMTMIRLLRRSGDVFEVLHTTRQSLVDGRPRANGYLLCGARTTFMSPMPTSMPEC